MHSLEILLAHPHQQAHMLVNETSGKSGDIFLFTFRDQQLGLIQLNYKLKRFSGFRFHFVKSHNCYVL